MIQLGERTCIIFLLSLVSSCREKVNKMCLNENYRRFRVGKHMSDMFPIRNNMKQGDALAPLLYTLL